MFFSCDTKSPNCRHCACYIYDSDACNADNLLDILKKHINYVNSTSKEDASETLLTYFAKSENIYTKLEIAFAMYAVSSKAYRKANLFKRSAYQMYKMLSLFKHYKLYNSEKSKDCIKELSTKALRYLWHASDDLNVFELNKRKKDFDKFGQDKTEEKIPLQNLLVDSEITKIRILVKELELKANLRAETLKTYYGLYITSPYRINYSIGGRIYRLRLKSIVNYEAYRLILDNIVINSNETKFVLEGHHYRTLKYDERANTTAKEIFGQYFEDMGANVDAIVALENIIAETIYCLVDIVQLAETMGETYVFTHSFFASIHEHLSFWIRQYEAYERYNKGGSNIGKLLEKYLDEEWRELLSGNRENRQAMLHYHKCLEMHNEGRAYHNMIDTMYYVKDDYNDRSDHFNIAEERHLITNKEIEKRIREIKDLYKESELYKIENYFRKTQN